jgi:hypothetical protein
MNVIEYLSGKKTYIVAVLVGIVAVAQYLGYITAEIATILYGLLGATGLATTRAAIAK